METLCVLLPSRPGGGRTRHRRVRPYASALAMIGTGLSAFALNTGVAHAQVPNLIVYVEPSQLGVFEQDDATPGLTITITEISPTSQEIYQYTAPPAGPHQIGANFQFTPGQTPAYGTVTYPSAGAAFPGIAQATLVGSRYVPAGYKVQISDMTSPFYFYGQVPLTGIVVNGQSSPYDYLQESTVNGMYCQFGSVPSGQTYTCGYIDGSGVLHTKTFTAGQFIGWSMGPVTGDLPGIAYAWGDVAGSTMTAAQCVGLLMSY